MYSLNRKVAIMFNDKGGEAMAKEAIQAVKTAEEEAKEVLAKAKQNSVESKKDAVTTADKKYQEVIKDAIEGGERIKEKALSEAKALSEPIITKGLGEAEKITLMTDEDIESAVKIIIERIVSTDGNS